MMGGFRPVTVLTLNANGEDVVVRYAIGRNRLRIGLLALRLGSNCWTWCIWSAGLHREVYRRQAHCAMPASLM